MAIVVTGATGNLGRLVVEHLLGRGVPASQIVATGRSIEKIRDLADRGVKVLHVDYDVPATIEAALSEGDKVLLISGSALGKRVAQHRAVVDAAAKAKVGQLLYTSCTLADNSPLIVAPDHAATEKAIRVSGLPFVFLRNGWYTENYARGLTTSKESGVLLSSAGDGKVACAPRSDYAAAIAAVLATDGHDNAVYELSGDTAYSFDDFADMYSKILGRTVVHKRLSPEEHVTALTDAGVEEQNARVAVTLDGNIRDGALSLTTGDLSRLSGRPTEDALETLKRFA